MLTIYIELTEKAFFWVICARGNNVQIFKDEILKKGEKLAKGVGELLYTKAALFSINTKHSAFLITNAECLKHLDIWNIKNPCTTILNSVLFLLLVDSPLRVRYTKGHLYCFCYPIVQFLDALSNFSGKMELNWQQTLDDMYWHIKGAFWCYYHFNSFELICLTDWYLTVA